MKVLRLISFASIVVTTCFINVIAQEPSQVDASPALPEFVVEVNRPGGCVASPVALKTKVGYLVYTLPRPAKVPVDTAGRQMPSKVFVSVRQHGEQWLVNVTVGTGEFFDAGDFKVGEFKLNLNERATVSELIKFGVPPIRVRVAKINRGQALNPNFGNLTKSVVLQSMQVMSLPDPFKLTLKNTSKQDLIAIQYNAFGPNGFLGLQWLSPGRLTPLIKSGENYELKVNSEDNTCGNDDGYSPNQTNRIALVSAVFADGTYEGEPALAALIKGTALGNKKNLLPAVQSIGHITDAAALSQQLHGLQEGMNEEADPYLVDLLRSMFPTLTADATPALTNYIRSGLHEIRRALKRDSQRLEMIIKRNNPEITKRWVDAIKKQYEQWYAAAEKITAQ